MCVSASVCLSVLEVSLPPIGRLAPSERVGRGFKDFFGTRGGNGLLGRGEKLRPVYPPPPIPGPGSCTWSISKLEIAVVCCVLCVWGGGRLQLPMVIYQVVYCYPSYQDVRKKPGQKIKL